MGTRSTEEALMTQNARLLRFLDLNPDTGVIGPASLHS